MIEPGATNVPANAPLPPGLLLHVGCGPITPDGWVNLDASWNLLAARVPGVRRVLRSVGLISATAAAHAWSGNIRYCNITRGFPFADGAAAVIYASHVLEHIPRRDAQAFMREANRVLQTGGVLRLVVPDLLHYARLYLKQKEQNGAEPNAANDFMNHLLVHPDHGPEPLPLKFYRAYLDTLSHKWMYDAESLGQLFTDAGFREIAPRGYLDSRIPQIAEVERANRFEDGICVEAVK